MDNKFAFGTNKLVMPTGLSQSFNSVSQPVTSQPANIQPPRKKKVLVWSDAVIATTGFGVVSKHILKALHETGLYDIDQLAINYFGDFVDKSEVPYSMVPARLNNPNDPYGNQMFLDAIGAKPYDIVFVVNDTFVVEGVSAHISEIKSNKLNSGQPVFDLVYYFPVDCRFLQRASTMAKAADRAVAYTEFAKRSAEEAEVNVTDVIYHGTDIKNFFPVPPEVRNLCRKRFFNIEDPDRFILVNVNRNNSRKDIARSILAFKEFRKRVPNSAYYLHTKMVDSPGHGHEIDLGVCIEELGLSTQTDVIFPNALHPAKGFPIEVLNQLYNAGDAYFTTTLGEGWGLTITEAMAAGIPVIAPNNTSIPEILGENLDRGYVYPCKEQVYVDNSGYRPYGSMEDIVNSMMQCYEDWKTQAPRRQEIVSRAKEFVHKYSWEHICKQWVTLFGELGNGNNANYQMEGEMM